MLVVLLATSTFFIPKTISSLDIYLYLRLPKYGVAFLAGASLAVAGYLSQLLLHNPLADPYVLGVSGGAGVGVNLAMYAGLPLFVAGFYMPYVYAFLGAGLVAFLLFYRLKFSTNHLTGILLIGLAINFFASAVISLFIYLSTDSQTVRDISFWFMGSYNKVNLNDFMAILSIVGTVMIFMFLDSKRLYQLHLGTRRLEELGLETSGLYVKTVLYLLILTAVIVATCGPIGFIGLLVPYLVRSLNLSANYVFVVCFALGGVLTLFGELLSSAFFEQSLPPGILTAMFGIPVFVYLLSKKYRLHV
jgi:iron complex transport system permease protein